jgi:hypothetical protein
MYVCVCVCMYVCMSLAKESVYRHCISMSSSLLTSNFIILSFFVYFCLCSVTAFFPYFCLSLLPLFMCLFPSSTCKFESFSSNVEKFVRNSKERSVAHPGKQRPAVVSFRKRLKPSMSSDWLFFRVGLAPANRPISEFVRTPWLGTKIISSTYTRWPYGHYAEVN